MTRAPTSKTTSTGKTAGVKRGKPIGRVPVTFGVPKVFSGAAVQRLREAFARLQENLARLEGVVDGPASVWADNATAEAKRVERMLFVAGLLDADETQITEDVESDVHLRLERMNREIDEMEARADRLLAATR